MIRPSVAGRRHRRAAPALSRLVPLDAGQPDNPRCLAHRDEGSPFRSPATPELPSPSRMSRRAVPESASKASDPQTDRSRRPGRHRNLSSSRPLSATRNARSDAVSSPRTRSCHPSETPVVRSEWICLSSRARAESSTPAPRASFASVRHPTAAHTRLTAPHTSTLETTSSPTAPQVKPSCQRPKTSITHITGVHRAAAERQHAINSLTSRLPGTNGSPSCGGIIGQEPVKTAAQRIPHAWRRRKSTLPKRANHPPSTPEPAPPGHLLIVMNT